MFSTHTITVLVSGTLMSSNTAWPASPPVHKTYPSNATKCLGLLDLPAKRQTSAKKQADKKLLADQ